MQIKEVLLNYQLYNHHQYKILRNQLNLVLKFFLSPANNKQKAETKRISSGVMATQSISSNFILAVMRSLTQWVFNFLIK